MRVAVDTKKCCGSGNCVMNAPEVFQADEVTGLVKLVTPEPAAKHWDEVRTAADECPTGAITLIGA